MTPIVFPDGRQFVPLTDRTGQWRELDGSHRSYVPVEHIEYAPTLGEEYLKQRGFRDKR